MISQRRQFLILFVGVLGLTVACGGKRPPLRVGAKTSTEQLILAEIVSLHLESKLQRPVERRFNLGGTVVAHQFLQGGEIDLYPEYTGSALTILLKADAIFEPSVALERVRQEYRTRMKVEWLEPLGFDSGFVMAIRTADAERLALTTLSQATAAMESWRMGVTNEFQIGSAGLGALSKGYDVRLQAAPRTMEPALMFQALREGSVDIIAANATDGRLNDPQLTVLKDDRGVFLPQQAAIVIRQDSLAAAREMEAPLRQLSGRIDSGTMRRLNAEVEMKQRSAKVVAAEWLKTANL